MSDDPRRLAAERFERPQILKEEPLMDWKIELIFVPVTDVDRAKEFYVKIGFHADHDQTPMEGLRFVQLTPPGSACSIAIGTGLGGDVPPGASTSSRSSCRTPMRRSRICAASGVEADGVDEQGVGSLRDASHDDPDGNRWTLRGLPARG